MKKDYSASWGSSSQPRKQRKYRHHAPLHQKHIFLSALLSDALQEKYGKRSVPVRKGDEVLIMRGSFKKKTAKITHVNLKRTRVTLEGINRTKKDGSKINVYLHPSVLMIQNLDATDKERLAALNRKGGAPANTKPSTPKDASAPAKKEVKQTVKKTQTSTKSKEKN